MVYCDSAILINFLEGSEPFYSRAEVRLRALRAAGDDIAVSDLTRLECRIKPIQETNAPQLAIFDTFFALADVRKVALSTGVYDRATELRARFAFKTVDALHLAAAKEAGCGLFLTPDRKLARCTDLPVEILA
jgi:predicted nucleic acid-binding protein